MLRTNILVLSTKNEKYVPTRISSTNESRFNGYWI